MTAGVICDCSEVHVSACITDSARAFCAINALGCRPTWPHYSPHIQRMDRETGSGIGHTTVDCRLCRKRNTKEPTTAPTTYLKPTPSPTIAPTRMQQSSPIEPSTPTVTINSEKIDDNAGDGNKNENTSAIIGGSIAGVVAIAAISVVYFKLFRGLKRGQMNDSNKTSEQPKPPTNLVIFSDDFKYDE